MIAEVPAALAICVVFTPCLRSAHMRPSVFWNVVERTLAIFVHRLLPPAAVVPSSFADLVGLRLFVFARAAMPEAGPVSGQV